MKRISELIQSWPKDTKELKQRAKSLLLKLDQKLESLLEKTLSTSWTSEYGPPESSEATTQSSDSPSYRSQAELFIDVAIAGGDVDTVFDIVIRKITGDILYHTEERGHRFIQLPEVAVGDLIEISAPGFVTHRETVVTANQYTYVVPQLLPHQQYDTLPLTFTVVTSTGTNSHFTWAVIDSYTGSVHDHGIIWEDQEVVITNPPLTNILRVRGYGWTPFELESAHGHILVPMQPDTILSDQHALEPPSSQSFTVTGLQSQDVAHIYEAGNSQPITSFPLSASISESVPIISYPDVPITFTVTNKKKPEPEETVEPPDPDDMYRLEIEEDD